jgi:hypothetical protein
MQLMPVSTGVNFCMQGCWSFFYPKKINTKKNDGTQRASALQGIINTCKLSKAFFLGC